MTEEEVRRRMREAFAKLQDEPGQEMAYATLYQQLVQMGAAPQLRRRYRP